ncbi:MAG TPA: ComEC/Rec2 family competence protein [Leptolyngbyaceae cyanobacterium]
MSQAISGVILCLAYIIGLLSTAFPWGGYVLIALGVGLAFILPRWWKKGPKPFIWVASGMVALLATIYFQAKVPQPATNDISSFIRPNDGKTQAQVVKVRGEVESTPRLTRNQRAQFWLKVIQLDEVAGSDRPMVVGKDVTGKLYVTVPLLQATGLHPGDEIEVTGNLYKPNPPDNPGSFDFQAYLAKEGAFAGLKGRQISLVDGKAEPEWGWWTIRQRIIRAQTNWLGIPEGPLVSAMVLGSQTVNLYLSVAIRDQFAKVGLAHALAASGFQVSLILSVVLALSRRLPVKAKFACGVTALLLFLGLTGPQPSMLRAILMGVAALFALVAERKIKPISSLLLAATLLLIVNPLWIWDLSFQLSFLATLGLVVTVPVLLKWLDWLPPLFASLIAVPIAASLWTLPLQLYNFKVISPYSVIVSIITTIPLTIISIGGFISAIAALAWPLAGSAIASLLYYPTHWLILLVEFFYKLPGNSVAVGAISSIQLMVIYGIILLVWLFTGFHKRWWIGGLIAILLIVIPAWQSKSNLFRVTVLSTDREPVLVIQDRGKVALINTGDANTARFTVIPFLQQEGVNKIDWAIATDSGRTTDNGWATTLDSIPIENFYSYVEPKFDSKSQSVIASAIQADKGNYQNLVVGQTVQIGSSTVKLINSELPIWEFKIQGENWLLLGELQPDQQNPLATNGEVGKTHVLWWSGQTLASNLLKALEPVVAISFSNSVAPETLVELRQGKTKFYSTSRDGAILWTPDTGFDTTLELAENQSSLL